MPIELPPVVGEDGVGALHSVVDVLEDFHLDPLAAEEGDGGVELPQGGGAVGKERRRVCDAYSSQLIKGED